MRILIAGLEDEWKEPVVTALAELDSAQLDLIEEPKLSELLSALASRGADIVVVGDLLVAGDPGHLIATVGGAAPRTPMIHLTAMESESYALSGIRLGFEDVVSLYDGELKRIAKIVSRTVERVDSRVQMVSQISDFVLTHSFDGIAAFDLQHRIILWNQGMERMFGRKRKEVLGRVVSEVLPFESIEAELRSAMDGRSFAGERMRHQSRGELRYYQPYFSSLTNRTGQVIGVMANFRDLTDATAKDRQLEDLQERVSQLANTIPGMVWMSDTQGSRNFFSRSWLDFTGSESESLSYDGWLVAMHPQDRGRYNLALQKALLDHRTFHIEYRLKRSDNVYRKMLDSASPVIGGDGSFLGFIGSCTDISVSGTTHHRLKPAALSKRAQDAAIQQQRAIETSTMEHAPIGLWKLDKGFTIIKASPAAASQLGYSPKNLVGQLFFEVVDSIPRDRILPALEGDETVQISRHKVLITNGGDNREVLWDISAWPLKDSEGRISGVYVSTIEVDDKMASERQKEDFVATLVHDLKTPLIGAERTLELLLSGSLGDVDDSQSEILSMLHRSNQGLLRMVQNLIEVYRYDYSAPHLAFEPCSLFDVAMECCRELVAVAEARGVKMEINLPLGQGGVQADSLSMKRVVSNLIDNSIKFTTRGGVIRVWGEETPNKVTVHVKDTGIGISQEELKNVFERFWRSQKNKGQSVGTGLGLYLCKQIIDAHGGDIDVHSQEEVGTTFSVALPRN